MPIAQLNAIKFGLCAKFVAVEGKRGELVNLLLEGAKTLEAMPDCRLYVIGTIDEETNAVTVTELWSDRDAHSRSLENQHVRRIVERAKPLIRTLEHRVSFRPAGGKGLQ